METLETRRVLASTIVLDFTPDSIDDEYDVSAFGDLFAGEVGIDAPPFLNYDDSNQVVDQADAELAARRISNRVRQLLLPFIKDESLDLKVLYTPNVVGNSDPGAGERLLQRGQESEDENVYVVYVGVTNPGPQGVDFGFAHQALKDENNEFYGYVFADAVADYFVGGGYRWNQGELTPQDYTNMVAAAVAHELGHLWGIGHTVDEGQFPAVRPPDNYHHLMSPPAQSNPAMARFRDEVRHRFEILELGGASFQRINAHEEVRDSLTKTSGGGFVQHTIPDDQGNSLPTYLSVLGSGTSGGDPTPAPVPNVQSPAASSGTLGGLTPADVAMQLDDGFDAYVQGYLDDFATRANLDASVIPFLSGSIDQVLGLTPAIQAAVSTIDVGGSLSMSELNASLVAQGFSIDAIIDDTTFATLPSNQPADLIRASRTYSLSELVGDASLDDSALAAIGQFLGVDFSGSLTWAAETYFTVAFGVDTGGFYLLPGNGLTLAVSGAGAADATLGTVASIDGRGNVAFSSQVPLISPALDGRVRLADLQSSFVDTSDFTLTGSASANLSANVDIGFSSDVEAEGSWTWDLQEDGLGFNLVPSVSGFDSESLHDSLSRVAGQAIDELENQTQRLAEQLGEIPLVGDEIESVLSGPLQDVFAFASDYASANSNADGGGVEIIQAVTIEQLLDHARDDVPLPTTLLEARWIDQTEIEVDVAAEGDADLSVGSANFSSYLSGQVGGEVTFVSDLTFGFDTAEGIFLREGSTIGASTDLATTLVGSASIGGLVDVGASASGSINAGLDLTLDDGDATSNERLFLSANELIDIITQSQIGAVGALDLDDLTIRGQLSAFGAELPEIAISASGQLTFDTSTGTTQTTATMSLDSDAMLDALGQVVTSGVEVAKRQADAIARSTTKIPVIGNQLGEKLTDTFEDVFSLDIPPGETRSYLDSRGFQVLEVMSAEDFFDGGAATGDLASIRFLHSHSPSSNLTLDLNDQRAQFGPANISLSGGASVQPTLDFALEFGIDASGPFVMEGGGIAISADTAATLDAFITVGSLANLDADADVVFDTGVALTMTDHDGTANERMYLLRPSGNDDDFTFADALADDRSLASTGVINAGLQVTMDNPVSKLAALDDLLPAAWLPDELNFNATAHIDLLDSGKNSYDIIDDDETFDTLMKVFKDPQQAIIDRFLGQLEESNPIPKPVREFLVTPIPVLEYSLLDMLRVPEEAQLLFYPEQFLGESDSDISNDDISFNLDFLEPANIAALLKDQPADLISLSVTQTIEAPTTPMPLVNTPIFSFLGLVNVTLEASLIPDIEFVIHAGLGIDTEGFYVNETTNENPTFSLTAGINVEIASSLLLTVVEVAKLIVDPGVAASGNVFLSNQNNIPNEKLRIGDLTNRKNWGLGMDVGLSMTPRGIVGATVYGEGSSVPFDLTSPLTYELWASSDDATVQDLIDATERVKDDLKRARDRLEEKAEVYACGSAVLTLDPLLAAACGATLADDLAEAGQKIIDWGRDQVDEAGRQLSKIATNPAAYARERARVANDAANGVRDWFNQSVLKPITGIPPFDSLEGLLQPIVAIGDNAGKSVLSFVGGVFGDLSNNAECLSGRTRTTTYDPGTRHSFTVTGPDANGELVITPIGDQPLDLVIGYYDNELVIDGADITVEDFRYKKHEKCKLLNVGLRWRQTGQEKIDITHRNLRSFDTATELNISTIRIEGSSQNDIIRVGDEAGLPGIAGPIFPKLIINAGYGDDTIIGGLAGDEIYGGFGKDTIYGNGGDDVIVGTPFLTGFGAYDDHDVIDGGAGDDMIRGNRGNDIIDGGDGEDTIFAGEGNDRVDGGVDRDFIDGGDDNDAILGGLGNDVIDGEGGDDFINGGEGVDVLTGGAGNDMLVGGAGDDQIWGGAGNDELFGDDQQGTVSVGIDFLYGESGHDYLKGGPSNDRLYGGVGADILIGDGGDDLLIGYESSGSTIGDANDLLDGGDGQDTLKGGPSGPGLPVHPSLDVSSSQQDILRGGAGNDRLEGGDGPDALDGGTFSDHPTDTFDGGLFGGAGDDEIIGGSGDDFIEGGSGADELIGQRGWDTIYGHSESGAGDDLAGDRIHGGSGRDLLYGQGGPDVISGMADEDLLDGGAGDDKLYGHSESNILNPSQPVGDDSARDYIYGRDGDDEAYGEGGDDIIETGDGDDVIGGGDGADQITSGNGSDTIDGGQGDDVITAGIGNDVIHAGAGDDTVDAGDGDDDVFGGDGIDTIAGGPGMDNLYGEGGDDVITGNEQNDVIEGGDGVDRLEGNAGDDTISGGVGDDVIFGHAGDDKLNGDDGDDQLFGDIGMDTIDGGAGLDRIEGNEDADTLRGGHDADIIDGHSGSDTIEGGGGEDTIGGGSEDDVIDGGDGADTIEGNQGDDDIKGDEGSDTIFGNGGNDIIHGHAGEDRIEGGIGDDIIDGGDDDDHILGQDGDDDISGGAANDYLVGQLGNDVIRGDLGDDVLLGSAGDDELDGGDGNDHIEGNDGFDTVAGAAGDDLIFGGNDADVITAGPGNDFVQGGRGDDSISGDDGDDELHGEAGDDQIIAGLGHDAAFGGDGVDTIDGGEGNDRIEAGTGVGDQLIGGAGDDTIIGSAGGGSFDPDFNDATFYGDQIDAGPGLDTIRARGGADKILGGDDDDMIDAGAGNDFVSGGDGDDWIALSLGTSDIAFGGMGDDKIFGSYLGNDVIHGDEGDDQIFSQGGADEVYGGPGDDFIDGGGDTDDLNGGTGDDELFGGGGSGDRIFGGDGHDILRGSDDGADLIDGGSGNDRVIGGGGNDVIVGGHGDDVLEGGPGDDLIEGGAGSDTLVGQADHDRLYGHASLDGDDDQASDTLYGDFGIGTLGTVTVAVSGTPGADQLFGNGGNDLLFGEAGDDFVDPGSGTFDTVNYGADEGAVASNFISPTPTPDPAIIVVPPLHPHEFQIPLSYSGGGRFGGIDGSNLSPGLAGGTSITASPAVATHGDTRYVAWSDDRGGSSEIFLLRHQTGSGWTDLGGSTGEGGISQSGGSSSAPKLVVLDDGTPVVAWIENEGLQSDIQAVRYHSATDSWVPLSGSGTRQVTDVGSIDAFELVALDGHLVLVWRDHETGMADLQARRFDEATETWLSLDGSVNGTGANAASESLDFAVSTSGNRLFLAIRHDPIADRRIRLSEFSAGTWTDLGESNGQTIDDGHWPSGGIDVALHNDEVFVTWQDSLGSERFGHEIIVVKRTDSGWQTIKSDAADGRGVSAIEDGLRIAADPQWVASADSLYLTWSDRPEANRQAVQRMLRYSGSRLSEVVEGDWTGDLIGTPTFGLNSVAVASDNLGQIWFATNELATGHQASHKSTISVTVTESTPVTRSFVANESRSIADILASESLGPGDRILVRTNQAGGFTLTSADAGLSIHGSPGVSVGGPVSITETSSINLAQLELTGDLTIDTSSTITIRDSLVTGLLTVDGGHDTLLVRNHLIGGVRLQGNASGFAAIDNVSDGVLQFYGSAQDVQIGNNELRSGILIDAPSSGSIFENRLQGALWINTPFGGVIEDNLITNAGGTAIHYAAAANLSGNHIQSSAIGVEVTGALLFGGEGDAPNHIQSNSTGVLLTDAETSVENQSFSSNSTGVVGTGIVGGNRPDRANQFARNGIAVQSTGLVRFNQFQENAVAIDASDAQTIVDNQFIDNVTAVRIDAKSRVQIVANEFQSTDGTNIELTAGASEIEIRNNVLQTDSGVNLQVDNDSTIGLQSDYNLLHAGVGGVLVHSWETDFTDLLDLQRDIQTIDLHSFGTTRVNPLLVQSYFVHSDSAQPERLTSVANTRRTDAATDGANRITRPDAAIADNLLVNASFESGQTSWTGSATLQSNIQTTDAFVGDQSVAIDTTVSGTLSQTVNLVAASVDLTEIDAGRSDVIYSLRMRGIDDTDTSSVLRFELEMLAGDQTVLDTVSLEQQLDDSHWHLVGDRVALIPQTRLLRLRVVSDGSGVAGQIESIDDAFVTVVADHYAGDIGYLGGLVAAGAEPAGPALYLRSPDLYVDWQRDVPQTIRWESFDVPVNEPIRIDLLRDSEGGPELLTTLTSATSNDGEFDWTPATDNIDFGTHGLRLQLSLANDPIVFDRSFESFSVPEDTSDYFVNDSFTDADVYTATIGDHRNTGRLTSAPKPSLKSVLDVYSVTAGDTISMDAGLYEAFYSRVISNDPRFGDDEGFTLQGASADTTLLRYKLDELRSPAVEIIDGDVLTIMRLDLSENQYGLKSDAASEALQLVDLVANSSMEDGFWIGGSATSLERLVAELNGGDGIVAQSSVGSVVEVVSLDNQGDGLRIAGNVGSVVDSTFGRNAEGVDLDNAGLIKFSGNTVFQNDGYGISISDSTIGSIIGGTDLTAADGNVVYENGYSGIRLGDHGTIAGNVVYGHASYAGIDASRHALVHRNVVHRNHIGIRSGGEVSENRVFDNGLGVDADQVLRNVIYSGGTGISTYRNAEIKNNLIYDVSDIGIELREGTSTGEVSNNTIDVSEDAIAVEMRDDTGTSFVNNIIRADGNAMGLSLDPPSQISYVGDFNNFHLLDEATLGRWQGTDLDTLRSWQLASGTDVNSASADPLFVDRSGADGVVGAFGPAQGFDDDYHLQSEHGRFEAGLLAPVLDVVTGLPTFVSATERTDAQTSPVIDRGDGSVAVADEPADNGGFINLGAYGGTVYASKSPADFMLVTEPSSAQDWPLGQAFDVSWRTTQVGGTVDVSLIPNDGGAAITILDDTVNDGTEAYTVDASVAPGSYQVEIRGSDGTVGTSTASIEVLGEVTEYFVNIAGDTDFDDNQYTTAAGEATNSGTTPGDPMPSLRQLLDAYDLGEGDVVYVDSGTYALSTNILITADDSGVRIAGPTDADKQALFDRGNTSAGAYAFELDGVAGISIESLGVRNAQYGFQLVNAADVILSDLSITSGDAGVFLGENAGNERIDIANSKIFGVRGASHVDVGIYIESGNSEIMIRNNRVYDNAGTGIYAANDLVEIRDNEVFANRRGIDVSYSFRSTPHRSVIGNTVYSNEVVGIDASGIHTTVTGNTIYDHRTGTGTGSGTGIQLGSHATARGNVVYNNLYGIGLSDATLTENQIFGNTVGIGGPLSNYYEIGDAQIIGNSIHSNEYGILNNKEGNYPLIASNLIYANTSGAIDLAGGYTRDGGTRIEGNTIDHVGGYAVVLSNSTGIELRNNIIRVEGGSAINVGADAFAGFESDYNLFDLQADARVGTWAGQIFDSVADWSLELGIDSDSLIGDPRFIDIDGADDVLGYVMNVVDRQIIDDGDDGFSATGNWSTRTNGGYDGDYLQGQFYEDASASWTFDNLTPDATYRLSTTDWAQNYNYRYRVFAGDQFLTLGTPTVFENTWGHFATFVAPTDSVTVSIQFDTENRAYPAVDAMRLEQLEINPGGDENYRLASGSPAIDAGDPRSFYFAEPSPSGDRVNLGAYGNTAEAIRSNSQTVQLLAPVGLDKWTTGDTETVSFHSSGLTQQRSVLTLNAGGSRIGNIAGDHYLVISDPDSTTQAIDTSLVDQPLPPEVYQTYQRTDYWESELAYQIPVPAGQYDLRLHFISGPNNRLFDLAIQGTVVESDVDLQAEAAGKWKALTKDYSVTVGRDEGISVQILIDDHGYAGSLSAIEITQPNPLGIAAPTASLDVSVDHGVTWTEIADGVPIDQTGQGQFDWTIPASMVTDGPTGRVRVRSGDVTTVSSGGLLISPPGNDFYVNIAGDTDFSDNQYTTAAGDNTLSGRSPDRPMASLAALLNAYDLDAGDVVYVDSGSYTLIDNLRITAADSGVTITGPTETGKQVVLDRGEYAEGSYGFELLGTSDITLSHLSIVGGNSGVFLAENSGNERIVVEHSEISGGESRSYSEAAIWIAEGNSDITIRNSRVYDNVGIGIYAANDLVEIRDNEVFANWRGIDVGDGASRGARRRVVGNSVYANEVVGIKASDIGTTVVSNIVFGHQTGTGVLLYDATASDNVIYDNLRGVSIGGGVLKDSQIYGNTYGVYSDRSGDAEIRGNTIYSNDQGIFLDDERHNPLITSNLIYANTNGAIYVNGGWFVISYTYDRVVGTRIEGNTIDHVGGDAVVLSSSMGIKLRNNIIRVDGGSAINVGVDAFEGFESDYNLFDLQAGASVGTWAGQVFDSVADWSFELGIDSNSFAEDPVFIDIDGADDVMGYEVNVVDTQIIDDGDDGFSTTGTWSIRTNGGYEGDYLSGERYEDASASWVFENLTPGTTYRLSTTDWQQSGRYEYRVFAGDQFLMRGTPTVFEDTWSHFATFVAPTTSVTVSIQFDTENRFYPRVDAMRLEQLAINHGGDEDYHLASGSVGIDAGDPRSFYFAEPSPSGDRVNLGAYGNTAEATRSFAQTVDLLTPGPRAKWIDGDTHTIEIHSSGLTQQRPVLALNAGGGRVGRWAANDLLIEGRAVDRSGTPIDLSALSNPAPAEVYQSYARSPSGYEPLRYELPLAAGSYELRLHFVSLHNEAFNLSIGGEVVEGAVELSNQAGGSDRGLVKTFIVTSDGQSPIEIRMDSLSTGGWVAEGLAGIEVTQANVGGTANPTAAIDVSTDNGVTWTEIATGVPIDPVGQGMFDWTIPASMVTDGPTSRVRVRSGDVTTVSSGGLLISPPGNDFYVNIAGDTDFSDNQYTTAAGENTFSGRSPDRPMASLAALLHAYDLDAGDVVYVDSGSYTLIDNLRVTSDDAGVTIVGPTETDKEAILDRGAKEDGIYGIELIGTSDVTLHSLSITGGAVGIYLGEDAGNERILIENNEVFETGQAYSSGNAIDVLGGNTEVTIRGNRVHDNGRAGISSSSDLVEIHDNEVFANQSGIEANSNGQVHQSVIRNTVFANENDGILAGGSTDVIDNVVFDHSGGAGLRLYGGPTVRGNVLYKNLYGVEILYGGTLLVDNRIHGNDYGVFSQRSDDSEIRGNAIYSNSWGVWMEKSRNTPLIASNLLYANTNGAISVSGGETNPLYRLATRIENNTVFQEVGDAVSLSNSVGVQVRNNIIRVDNGAAINVASNAFDQLLTDFNLFDIGSGTSAAVGQYGATNATDLATWQTLTADAADSLIGDPLFIDIGGIDDRLGFSDGVDYGHDDNFALAKTSPAIDRGYSWTDNDLDYFESVARDDLATNDQGGDQYRDNDAISSAFAVSGQAQSVNHTAHRITSYTLPFAFPMFDIDAPTVIYISNEGLINFDSWQRWRWNSASDDNFTTGQRVIAGLWQNIHTGSDGDDIYIDDSVADQVTIYWDATSKVDNADVKFGVRLFASGVLEYLYGTTGGLDSIAGFNDGFGNVHIAPITGNQSSLTDALVRIDMEPGVRDIGAIEFRGQSDDDLAPTVVATTPAGLNNQQVTSNVFDSLELIFNEEMNSIDASAFAAYQLREAGPNGALGDGDDTVIPLAPDFQLGSSTVQLQIDPAFLLSVPASLVAPGARTALIGANSAFQYYLPDGKYRFELFSDATGSVRDTAGLATDGDDNGTPGGDYVRLFDVQHVPEILQVNLTENVPEGDTAMLTGIFRDLSDNGGHMLQIDWGDGSELQTVAVSDWFFEIEHRYEQDSRGRRDDRFDVQVTLLNSLQRQSDSSQWPLSIQVDNVVPELLPISLPEIIHEDEIFALEADFLDTGLTDLHTLSIDWGDGNPEQTVGLSVGQRAFSISKSYAKVPSKPSAQTRTVRVSVADEHGVSQTMTQSVQLLSTNSDPSIEDQTISFTGLLDEGRVLGQLVANDPDIGNGNEDTLQFEIVTSEIADSLAIDNEGTISIADDASLSSGEYPVLVRVTDGRGAADFGWITLQLQGPPEIESIAINDGSNSRSMIRTISIVINGMLRTELLDEAFTITNIDSGQVLTTLEVGAPQEDQIAGTTTVVLTFAADDPLVRQRSGSGLLGNSLIDGNYRLDIAAEKIVIAGTDLAMATDYVFGDKTFADQSNDTDKFYALFGDVNANGSVDFEDFSGMGEAFGSPNDAFDFNGNGTIDFDDFSRFGQNFGNRRSS